MKLENIAVCNLENAVKASKYPMSSDISTVSSEMTDTVKLLGSTSPGEGHDNYLLGIVVIFDLTCSNKMWIEFERYHFADIVSSQSTMHRVVKLTETNCFNEYVTDTIKQEVERLANIYKETQDKNDYLSLLYNIPSGIELTAQVVTNYRQLKTMVIQRQNHRLPEWRSFCRKICELPNFTELTGIKMEG